MELFLASGSPRRQELLQQIGTPFYRLSVDVDETPLPDENPKQYVERLALAKAKAGWLQSAQTEKLPVLGADTAVVCNGRILGKPKDKRDALAMLAMLSGKTHEVLSAVALVKGNREECLCVSTRVTFRTLSPQEREAYWNTGEPGDKAGSYGIQGYAAVFVSRIEGSYSGVVGLPLAETARLLKAFNVPVWSEWIAERNED